MSARYTKVVHVFWLVMSASIFAIWGVSFASGKTWADGLFVYQNGNIPIFHLVAENLMAVLVITGVLGRIRGARWGNAVTSFGLGMFGYSAVNSLGWALHNSPVLAVPMGLSWVGVLLFLPLVLDARRAKDVA